MLHYIYRLRQETRITKKSIHASITRQTPKRNQNYATQENGLKDLSDRKTWLNSEGVPVKIDTRTLIKYLGELNSEQLDFDGENGGYLQSLFFWCDPQEFDEALAIFSRSRGNPAIKDLYLNQLLEKVIKNGDPNNFGSVLDLLKKSFGSGTLAADAIRSAFAKAGFSQSVLLELRKIENPEQRKQLLQQMVGSLQWEENLTGLNNLKIQDLTAEEKLSLYQALALRVKNSKGLGLSIEDTLKDSISLIKEPKEISALLTTCAKFSPFDVWKLLSSYSQELGETGLIAAQAAAVSSMAAQDGNLALNRVLELQNGRSRAELIQQGLLAFLTSNPNGAKKWIEENRKALSSVESDAANASLSQFSLKNNDLDSAKLMLNQITDPDIHKKTEGEIWTAERDSLRNAVGADPAGTLQGLVSGQSKYADYWLEEAMGTWVSKDFDKAQEWYQQNWKSLPSSKSQGGFKRPAQSAVVG